MIKDSGHAFSLRADVPQLNLILVRCVGHDDWNFSTGPDRGPLRAEGNEGWFRQDLDQAVRR
jgi:hypothetical protein